MTSPSPTPTPKPPGKDAGGLLKKQVGPLPVGIWIAIVGGGLLISYYISNKNAKPKTEDAVADPTPTALVYTGTGGMDSAPVDDTTTGAPETNEDWARRAKQFLIGRGNDGAIVNSAIDKFIAAQPLNAQEQALLSQAIGAVGPPPQSLPPVDQPNTPTQYTWDNPAPNRGKLPGPIGDSPAGIQGQQYTVKSGDTLTSIAMQAYGAAPNDFGSIIEGSDEIYNANWYKITDPKTLTPGTVLYIPVINSNTFAHQGLFALGGGAKKGVEQRVWQVASGLVPVSGAYYGSSYNKEHGLPSTP